MFRLVPIVALEDESKARTIHINLDAIAAIYKQGDNYYLVLISGHAHKVNVHSYQMLLNWKEANNDAEDLVNTTRR